MSDTPQNPNPTVPAVPPVIEPITPPVLTPPVTPPANPPADPSLPNNEENKLQRQLEAAQKERDQLKAEIKKREDAELSESERLKKERDEATAERDQLKTEILKRRIAEEEGVPAEAMEFLTGTDESSIRAQAQKLGGIVKVNPVKAGTVTNPGGGQQPTLEEQITAAEKAGDRALSINLRRKQANMPGYE